MSYTRHRPALLIGDPGYLPAVGDESDEVVCETVCEYFCTRPAYHTGDHAAHGCNDQQFASWGANNS